MYSNGAGTGFAIVLPLSSAFGANQNKNALALILRKGKKKYRGFLFMRLEDAWSVTQSMGRDRSENPIEDGIYVTKLTFQGEGLGQFLR
jgi:hypothetical protein